MASCKSCDAPQNPMASCPARMADGRMFTDYRPRCAVQAELMNNLAKQNMVFSSYEARMFMQHNTEAIIDQARLRSLNNLAPCAPCQRPFSDPGTMLPERYVVRCTPTSCVRTEVNPNGVGDGRSH